MKNKFKSRKKIIFLTAVTGTFLLGIWGRNVVMAAGEYKSVTLESYGKWIFDDGDTANNNGKQYDIVIDTGDLEEMNQNLNVLNLAVNTAQSTASAAKTAADTAQSTANNAKTAADTAQSTANTAKSTADANKTSINSLNTTVSKLKTDVDACFQSVSSGKALLASTLTDLGVQTAADATFATIDANIRALAKKKYDSGYNEGKAEGNKIYDLGTGQTFDVSSYEGYGTFTNANFICEQLQGTVEANCGGYATESIQWPTASTEATVYKSYNASTGVLNARETIKTRLYSEYTGATTKSHEETFSVHAYLVIWD